MKLLHEGITLRKAAIKMKISKKIKLKKFFLVIHQKI